MTSRDNARWPWARVAAAAIGLWLSCEPAFSQAESPPAAPTPPGREIFYSRIEPLTATIAREQSDPRPQTTGNALRALDWLIYGNVTVGGAYDSNVFSSPNQQAVYGSRFQPSIVAARNTGIQRTLVYGTADVRYYPSIKQTQLLDTTGGLAHVWEIQRDLVFRTQAEVTRGREASLNVLNAPSVLYTQPVSNTSLFASTSIEKSFGRFFTAIGGSVTHTVYEDTRDNLGNIVAEQFRNGTKSVLSGRLGYHLSPLVYTFVEPSVNAGHFAASILDSHGYQIKAGLGTERISLFNGEVYGGYLAQEFSNAAIPPLTDGIYGGRVSWYPTRFLTFTASVDQSIGTSDFNFAGFALGTVTKVNTSTLKASWEATRVMTLEGRLQFQHYDYLNTPRVDNRPEVGLAITYMLTERFGVVVDYSHSKLTSNIAGAGYSRDLVSIGGKTKF